MKKSIKAMALGVIATATIASGVITSPASADSSLTVTVSKTTELSRSGESVDVTITGIPNMGFVYAYQCAATAITPRPTSATNCVEASKAIGLTNTVAFYGYQGLLNGSVPQKLALTKTFSVGANEFDCSVVSCAIFIRRGEDGRGSGSDVSLDQLIPITFMAAPKPTLTAKVVSKIKFEAGVTKLTKNEKKMLASKANDFQIASQIVITATAGSTMGASEGVVKKLAKKRANAIKKYLITQGVLAENIVIKVKIAKSGTKPSTKIVANP